MILKLYFFIAANISRNYKQKRFWNGFVVCDVN